MEFNIVAIRIFIILALKMRREFKIIFRIWTLNLMKLVIFLFSVVMNTVCKVCVQTFISWSGCVELYNYIATRQSCYRSRPSHSTAREGVLPHTILGQGSPTCGQGHLSGKGLQLPRTTHRMEMLHIPLFCVSNP